MGHYEQLHRCQQRFRNAQRNAAARLLVWVLAIPAVVIYNVFARMIASYKASLGDVAAQVVLL